MIDTKQDHKVKNFAASFRGRSDCWGKLEGCCVREKVTLRHYREHLEGRCSLGVYPLLPDSTVWWAAIDIDNPDINHAMELVNRLKHYGLKAYIARSKRKGHHVYLFLKEPIAAWKIRAILALAIAEAGLKSLSPQPEIFPKQDDPGGPDSPGNYLNLPYYPPHAKNGRRVVLDPDDPSRELTLEEFLCLVEPNKSEQINEIIELNDLTREPKKEWQRFASDWRAWRKNGSRPLPCTVNMETGVAEGCRNDVMFTLAKRYYLDGLPLDDAQERLHRVNQNNRPPLADREIDSVLKSAFDRGYTSLGCEQPFMETFCDKENCPVAKAGGHPGKLHQPITSIKDDGVMELLWAKDIPPPEAGDDTDALLEPFLFPGSGHLLSGQAGVGKTTLAYNLAVKAARGEEFLGLPFARCLRVLCVDLETPKSLHRRKLHLIAEGKLPDGLGFIRNVGNLEKELPRLAALVREHHFDLVIIDTLTSAFQLQDENDNAEATRIMRAIRNELIEPYGCAVLLCHHLGKDPSGHGIYKGRGASAFPAQADIVLNLEAKDQDTLCLEMVKNRWLGGVHKLFMKKVGEDIFEPYQVPGEEDVMPRFKAKRFILRLLADGRQRQCKDILTEGKKEGHREPTVERALSDLRQLGKIVRPCYGRYALPGSPSTS